MKIFIIFVRLLLTAVFQLLPTFAVDEKSCETTCYTDRIKKPECGVWAHSDNVKTASGIYKLDSDHYANLSCTMTSLPKPVHLDWLFQAEGQDEFLPVECDSTRAFKHCKYNVMQEHQVTVICVMQINDLDQNGIYKCSGKAPGFSAFSHGAHLKVHGIANFSQSNSPITEKYLIYNKPGEIRVLVCGHPRPHITWIHDHSGVTLTAVGGVAMATDKFAALPAHHFSERMGQYEPLKISRYCYEASLLIGKVNATDKQFTVIASNEAETKTLKLNLRISNLPKSDASNYYYSKTRLNSFYCAVVIIFISFVR